MTKRTDIKALEEANGKDKTYYDSSENAFLLAVNNFVGAYEDMLSKCENDVTMAYISQDIVKVFLKGANRVNSLSERIRQVYREVEEGKNSVNYLQTLIDSLGHSVENKCLEHWCNAVCRTHDDFLLQVMKSSNNDGIISMLKTSDEIQKDILARPIADNKRRLEELKQVFEFNRKNII